MDRARERRLDLWLVAITVVLVVAAGGTGVAAVADLGPFHDEPLDCKTYSFDREAWADSSSRPDEATALSRCRMLTGLDRAQVHSMLRGVKNFSSKSRRYQYYVLYSDIDTTYLAVKFADSGKAKDAQIETH